MPHKARPVVDRIMDKVRKDKNGCWIFTGCRIASGYGKIAVTRSKPAFTHRVMFEQVNGPIPEGFVIMHTCDNPSCVNPDHLRAGTQKDNWNDARAKGRNYAAPQVTPNYRYVNHYVKNRGL